MILLKNIHEKLLDCLKVMLIDTKINLPYYGQFCLHIAYHENDRIGTCGVNITTSGMNFYYDPTFLDNISQKEVNFINIHEIFHLLFDHPTRTVSGQYNHKLANIAQDMIINHTIWEDIPHDFVEIPKSVDGKNMALFVPKDYPGLLVFEPLYEWLNDEKQKWNKSTEKSNSTENKNGKDSTGKPAYGPYGKNPSKNSNVDSIDTWSKEQIFDDMEKNNGEYLDKHMGDEVPEEMREAIVKDIMDRLAARGFSSGQVESTINKLRKKRKDFLKEIKRSISNVIFGTVKQKTIVKPNRRQIPGLKGNKKIKNKINVLLDVSGSMSGLVEKVLNYVYRSDVELNLLEADTKIQARYNIKKTKELERIKIVGMGGTVLQPGIDHIVENFNELNTVILTDGCCDSLDLSRLGGRVLIISAGVKVPITRTNGKVKQILVEKTE